MGLPLVEVKMAEVKLSEVVHERYHHGRVVGEVDPNLIGYPPNQDCFMLAENAYYVVGEKKPEMREVGFKYGRTEYSWTEPKP